VEGYTQFEADYPDIEINFEGTGDFDWSAEELYCWYKWLITTDFGIRTYFGALEPVDIGTLVIKTDVVDMFFDNENAGTSANEVTGITISRDDPIEPRPKKAGTAGSISVNWSKVYAKVLTVSGASVITGDISDITSAITSATVEIKGSENKDLTQVFNNTPTIDVEAIDEVLSANHGEGLWTGGGGGGATPEEIDTLLTTNHGAGLWNQTGGGVYTEITRKPTKEQMKELGETITDEVVKTLSEREISLSDEKVNEQISRIGDKGEQTLQNIQEKVSNPIVNVKTEKVQVDFSNVTSQIVASEEKVSKKVETLANEIKTSLKENKKEIEDMKEDVLTVLEE
jgi:transcriptional regulator CtsR